MRPLLALLFALLPFGALAQPYPALHAVAGVAANDVLNIRAEPSAASRLIGTLEPDAGDVEVIRLSDSGTWGLVNTGEGAGWVSMHYLTRNPGQEWGDFPAALDCAGTEPFWSARLDADGSVRFETPETAVGFPTGTRFSSRNDLGRFAIRATGPEAEMTAVLAFAACSDGMSDSAYGISLDLLFKTPDRESLYSGCCRLSPRP